MALPYRFTSLEAVLNIDTDLFGDPTALAENLAERPSEPRIEVDPEEVAAIMSLLREAQAKGQSGVLIEREPADPRPYMEAAKMAASKRPARQSQLRRSEKLVEGFLEEVAGRSAQEQKALTRDGTEALAVLREMAQQVANEPTDSWNERRASEVPFPLDLLLTPEQLQVLNELLPRSTVWEGFLCGPVRKGGARRVAFRDVPLKKGELKLQLLLGQAARSLVELLSPKSRYRLGMCRAPLAWGRQARPGTCGLFVVASTRGKAAAQGLPVYCSKTCSNYAYIGG